jgi:hypothetical protein
MVCSSSYWKISISLEYNSLCESEIEPCRLSRSPFWYNKYVREMRLKYRSN